MWVFRNNSFVSAVEDRADGSLLKVRARVKGDLEAFFEGVAEVEVERTPEADYLFRTTVTKVVFAEALTHAALGIDYPNFKDSIPKTKVGDRRHDAYMRVWTAMMSLQRLLVPRSGYWSPRGKGWKP